MTPVVRQWIYIASAVASALIPILVTYNVVDHNAGTAWANLVAVLGAIGSGGAATAAVVVNKQRKEGTLEFSGTPAEQAVAAIKATIERAGTAASDLDVVRKAINSVLNSALNQGASPATPPAKPGEVDAGTMGH